MRLRVLLSLVGFGALGCGEDAAPAEACVSSAECEAGAFCVDGTCVAAPDGGLLCDGPCECTVDIDCARVVPACVEAVCVDRSCFFRPDDSRCAGGACHFVDGCTGDADGGNADGGSSTDGSTPDAGPAPIDGGPTRDAGGPGPIGAACTTDSDCAPLPSGEGGQCLLDVAGAAFMGGYCSAPCDLFTMVCGPGAVCVRDLTAGSRGLCMQTCVDEAECRTADGYVCSRPDGVFTRDRVCAPRGF